MGVMEFIVVFLLGMYVGMTTVLWIDIIVDWIVNRKG